LMLAAESESAVILDRLIKAGAVVDSAGLQRIFTA